MNNHLTYRISTDTGIPPQQTAAVLHLLDSGCTIPFIARYRKEATGSLDETQIMDIQQAREDVETLEKRREAILRSLSEQSVLSAELEKAVKAADSLTILEDIYLPYKRKRTTRADTAIKAGLKPLADWLLSQATQKRSVSPNTVHTQAATYISDKTGGVSTAEKALAGARDILAQRFSEDKNIRKRLRKFFEQEAEITSAIKKGKEQQPESSPYTGYASWREPAATAPSHRILALLRGSEAGILTVHMRPDKEKALRIVQRFVFKHPAGADNEAARQVNTALTDSYTRLLLPSLEQSLIQNCKKRADKEAVKIFGENLRELLLAPPLGQKRVLAVDPGLRTGCKVACLDAQGNLLGHDVIFPLPPYSQTKAGGNTLRELCTKHCVDAVAVGNGTGGREAHHFVTKALKEANEPDLQVIPVIMVDESGASVYSASHIAREEFPTEDITVRSAVSIGRRLIDPLAELVKIDPKSIGVGQYQHDVDQKLLKQTLEEVVSLCVNAVGVDVNTASKELLQYVSGITPRIAKEICSHRLERGRFSTREALRQVAGIGPKCFEQAAGFLRIHGGTNPLDASAVHPESYSIVEQMATDLGCTIEALLHQASLRQAVQLKDYITEHTGMPTLQDIMQELEQPGRDPRQQFTYVNYREDVNTIEDLQPGMQLPGIVTNVTAFGAFVDIGVHKDGLIHISELSETYVRDPHEIVQVHQPVTVTVLAVEPQRKRIKLTLKGKPVQKEE
ncbi:MAG: Tex family protein [Spirochaetota bacterium]